MLRLPNGLLHLCSPRWTAASRRLPVFTEERGHDDSLVSEINECAGAQRQGRTQEANSRALRMLCEFYSNPPEEIDEAALEACFLHRRNVDRWSANTLRICYCGIRFYFVKVLQRDWNLFNFLRAKSESRLPAVLSRDEVRALLACVRTPHNRAFLNTVCACGLRLQEALYLEVADIDSDRIMIHVHRRIASCRCPKATLETLRSHWRSHRHPRLLFLSLGSGQPFGGPRHDTHGDQQRPGGVCSAKERRRCNKSMRDPEANK